ncbi:MAG: hypothetical protein GY847_06540 [Proteobacteria bacterium]|nr:hypothetical protein [Pseudomonadota bacterium]
MGSISSETRERQKEKAETEVQARRALLAEKGIESKAAKKDPILRKLEARLKKAVRQLAAIEKRDEHVKEVAAKVASEKQKSKGKSGGKPGKKAAAPAKKPAKKK